MPRKVLTRKQKRQARFKRHLRIRNKIVGSSERPRLNVFRSLTNIYAQLVDDIEEKTILSCSTRDKEVKDKMKYGGNVKAATLLGDELAKKAKGKGIKEIVFDRAGYLYHGRIKALADALRKGGLEF